MGGTGEERCGFRGVVGKRAFRLLEAHWESGCIYAREHRQPPSGPGSGSEDDQEHRMGWRVMGWPYTKGRTAVAARYRYPGNLCTRLACAISSKDRKSVVQGK